MWIVQIVHISITAFIHQEKLVQSHYASMKFAPGILVASKTGSDTDVDREAFKIIKGVGIYIFIEVLGC